jgi:hypothetical protein
MARAIQGSAPSQTYRIGSRYEQTVPAWTPAERILLALRAGAMDSAQFEARFGFEAIGSILGHLVRARYVSRTGTGAGTSVYRLTEAGRAVCPCRNPAAAMRREAA